MHYTFMGTVSTEATSPVRNNGALVACEQREATAYAIVNIQERGTLFIRPGTMVYEGMIIGEHSRENDLYVNVTRKRHVTNIRSSTAEIAPKIDEPRILSLEEALAFVAEDELVEITPKSIRLRKAVLGRKGKPLASLGFLVP